VIWGVEGGGEVKLRVVVVVVVSIRW
jgi:hypothetical protein